MLCVDFVIKYNATESLTLLMDIPSYQNSVYDTLSITSHVRK